MSMFVGIHKALMYYSFSFPSEPYQIDFSHSIWVCLKAGHPVVCYSLYSLTVPYSNGDCRVRKKINVWTQLRIIKCPNIFAFCFMDSAGISTNMNYSWKNNRWVRLEMG